MTAATAPLFRIPDEAAELLPLSLSGYVLPADPITSDVLRAWDVAHEMERAVGSLMRLEASDSGHADFYLGSARVVAAAAQQLIDAIKAAA